MNGNKVNANEWADTLSRNIIEQFIQQYIERATNTASTMTCSEHGNKAEIIFTVEGNPEQPTINIKATACCDTFAAQVVEEAMKCWGTD